MRSRPRIRLLIFGGGTPNWRWASQRLARQALASGWFDQVHQLTDRDLARNHPEFWRRHERILRASVRGFGYWIWKPYLIEQSLINAVGLDYVLYLDAGFEINPVNRASEMRLLEYCDIADKGRFAMELSGYPEYAWTKRDVTSRLNLTEEQVLSDQLQAHPLLATSRANVDFCAEWLELCVVNSYHLVDDSPSIAPNYSSFVEHRHDQSVFSCLMKVHGFSSVPDETFWAPHWATSGAPYPLWAARNRTSISVADPSAPRHVWRLVQKAASRAHIELQGTGRVARTLKSRRR